MKFIILLLIFLVPNPKHEIYIPEFKEVIVFDEFRDTLSIETFIYENRGIRTN